MAIPAPDNGYNISDSYGNGVSPHNAPPPIDNYYSFDNVHNQTFYGGYTSPTPVVLPHVDNPPVQKADEPKDIVNILPTVNTIQNKLGGVWKTIGANWTAKNSTRKDISGITTQPPVDAPVTLTDIYNQLAKNWANTGGGDGVFTIVPQAVEGSSNINGKMILIVIGLGVVGFVLYKRYYKK
jgi:hypothetical protein